MWNSRAPGESSQIETHATAPGVGESPAGFYRHFNASAAIEARGPLEAEPAPHEPLGLFDTPPNRRQIRFGIAVIVLLLFASIPVLLLRNIRLAEVGPAFPMVDAVMFVGQLITAALLYAQSGVFRSQALAILATSYLFTGLLLVPHALTFPGAFSRDGLLGAGVNSTGWIAIVHKLGYAVGAILYVHFKPANPAAQPDSERPAPRVGLQIFAAIVLTVAVTILATSGLQVLPPLFLDRAHVIRSNLVAYEGLATALWIVAIVMLWRKRSSVLDMWLLVALVSWLIQSLINMTLPGRFTAGFYWMLLVMLVSHLIVMLALIAESSRFHGRLALSLSARNREREARLMSIDALASAICHDVAQPMTAVGYYANSGLKSLSGERPDVPRAIKSMLTVIEAGNRAVEVIKSVRATFGRRASERTEFRLDGLVETTVTLLQRELDSQKITVQFAADETQPPVLADLVQLQRVLINLISNAIEALAAVDSRPRQITIRSATLGSCVVVEISDNGAGIAPENMARIFDAYFTTKAAGTGLGLPLCRAIVEAHGGRLWASRGADYGATFHLKLPVSGSHAPTTTADYAADPAA
jgi:signal transduction histidine kinase